MSLIMVKLPSSSSSTSESDILPAKPPTRSKKRLLPKNTGWYEKSCSKPLHVSKTKVKNVWQLFSETKVSPKKRNSRQKKKPAQKKKIPATVTHPTEIIEEEMEDLIIEDDIEVMRDVSASAFSSPKRSEKFNKFLQKFNKSSRIRKEFKSPRPIKRKRLASDHKPIPEFDDLEYDVFEDIDSSECLKAQETATGVSIQYENSPKYLKDSPSIPVGLSRKFFNSTAVDGHQNNLLEFTQDISVIKSGSSKQTSEETTPSRLPALHTRNKRRKKSCNDTELDKKKPASSTRLFHTNNSDISIPDLSPIIHVTGKKSLQAKDVDKSRNKNKTATEDHSEDAVDVIENPPSPLSLIKIIVDKTLINKQSTFRQDDAPEAEFGISSIKDDDDDDDDDFLQPRSDTRYIDSRDFYQTYDIEEIEVPDVICIDDEEDKDLVPLKTNIKDSDKSQNTLTGKQNEDQNNVEYNTNNNSISSEDSTIVDKLLNRKSSKLSKTAQTILEVSSPGTHISLERSVLVEKPSKRNSSKLSKTAQTILEVASPGIRNNDSLHNSGEESTLLEKPLKRKSSKLSKTAQTILKVASPDIGDSKNKNNVSCDDSESHYEKPLKRKSSKCSRTILEVASPMDNLSNKKSMVTKSCPSSLTTTNDYKSKERNKTAANFERVEDFDAIKNTTVKSRRKSTSRAVEKEISICCLQTLKFPPPLKVLIRQKTIPNGKRFSTEIQTAPEDILCKAVPPPKGISKECRKKRCLYYFKDVKRYGRGK